ncbi:hypothetical protein [Streptomyces goshikiensis]|uniref:hypothetical protein n=1 Tax=Streptomyces goshikiensis TaxID=1942 RepID=UPI0036B07F11
MPKRTLPFATIAAAAAVVASVVCLPTAQAAGRPDFRLPAPCGETWGASTYAKHQPAYSVDLNYYPEDTGRPVVASAAGIVTVADSAGGWAGTHVRIDQGGPDDRPGRQHR